MYSSVWAEHGHDTERPRHVAAVLDVVDCAVFDQSLEVDVTRILPPGLPGPDPSSAPCGDSSGAAVAWEVVPLCRESRRGSGCVRGVRVRKHHVRSH